MSDPYYLHRLVWRDDVARLKTALDEDRGDLETKDPHGRTPLMLAVCLGHLESSKLLIESGANVNTETEGWTVVQEATATGNPRLVQLVLEERDKARYGARMGGIPELLVKLKDAPDFYVEMTWEFTSWVPLVSRMCPSDTYKVYKRGSSVRVDTTLLGFDQNSWVRGSRTYIFTGENSTAKFLEIDHDTQQVYIEEMSSDSSDLESMKFSSAEQVEHRLSTPLVQTYLDTENISFQRTRSGLFGWGGERTETVSGMECKVFAANNVEIVTKTRTEHMSEDDKEQAKANKNPLLSIFGPSENEVDAKGTGEDNNGPVTEEDYFSGKSATIGTPKEQFKKSQKFKAQLWLCEAYPLSLQEQVLPIVDLLAISNSHFQKLKDFIHMQLPAGFPVKIEIPLFHLINARITFSNIQALDSPIAGVTSLTEDGGRSSAAIDDSVYDIPPGYVILGGSSENAQRQYAGDEEDLLLQYAIRQSLDNDTATEQVDIWEALEAMPPAQRVLRDLAPLQDIAREERLLQEAIEASMRDMAGGGSGGQGQPPPPLEGGEGVEEEGELARAIRISQEQEQQRQDQLRREEDELLARVLALSLQEQ